MPAIRPPIASHSPHRQRGAAFMVMLVILIIGAVTILVSALNSSSVKIARDQTTADALAKAKEALIGYAVTYADTHSGQVPGYLPCPDNNGGNPEGSAEPSCGSKNISQVGRFPWRTLGLDALRDGNGECLWYAVAGTYKNNSKTDLMNWDNNGLFQVLGASGQILAGQTADTQAVAVIFAPGTALNGQDRAPDNSAPICGGNYTASNYLDHDAAISANNATPSTVANAISQFFTAGATTNINDQIIYITKDDIWNAIKKRNDFQLTSPSNVLYQMTQAAATCMAVAGSPAPSPTNSANASVGWVPVNSLTSGNCGLTAYNTWNNWWSNWFDHMFYDPSGAADVNGTQYDVVVLFANPKLSGQTRLTAADKSDPKNYLEGNNLKTFNTGAPDYQQSSLSGLSATANDVLYCANNSSPPAIFCP